jgi:serine/threonine-protein kinase
MRIFAGVGAWLLGVGAATAGSLLAVSLLGQGIADTTSQQLTAAAVNHALSQEASEASTPSAPAADPPVPKPSVTSSSAARPSAASAPETPETQATPPAARTAPPQPTPSPSSQTSGSASPTPIASVLTSPGGTVVADCRPAGAYLVSWSPTQGYEVGNVRRGPAATTQVTFVSIANSVTMLVSCSGGVPSATITIGGGDDGGGPDR